MAVIISGVPEFDSAIEGLKLKVDAASRRIVERGGVLLASDAKRSFLTRPSGSQRTSKRGRTYYSFKPPYQAQPPKATNRSGHLSRSIKVQVVSKVFGGWMSGTGPSMMYAPYVEYGTSKMRAEPFMGSTLDKSMGKLQAIAEDEWMKVNE